MRATRCSMARRMRRRRRIPPTRRHRRRARRPHRPRRPARRRRFSGAPPVNRAGRMPAPCKEIYHVTFWQQLEVNAIKGVASFIQSDEANLEQELGPIEGGAITRLAAAFATLPSAVAAMLDAAFAMASQSFTPAELNGFVGAGLNAVVTF